MVKVVLRNGVEHIGDTIDLNETSVLLTTRRTVEGIVEYSAKEFKRSDIARIEF